MLSNIQDPIQFETPRTRKFYQQTMCSLEQTNSYEQQKKQDFFFQTPYTPFKQDFQFCTSSCLSNENFLTQSKEKQIYSIKKIDNQIKKQKEIFVIDKKQEFVEDQTEQKFILKKRNRKSNQQILILKKELEGIKNLSRDKLKYLCQLTSLSKSQIYKWFWDQKQKKDELDQNDFNCINKQLKF